MSAMHRVIELCYLGRYRLRLHFDDGTVKVVNLEPFIGKAMSAPLLDEAYFRQGVIDSAGGVVWPNGYDICPNFLYGDVPTDHSDSPRGERARRLIGGGRQFSPERDSVAELVAEREAEDSSSF